MSASDPAYLAQAALSFEDTYAWKIMAAQDPKDRKKTRQNIRQ